MGQKVTVEMDAKDAGLWAAWQEAKRGPQEYSEALDKITKKSKEAKHEGSQFTEAAKAGLEEMVGPLLKFGTAAGAVVATLKQIKEQIDHAREAATDAAVTQTSLAPAQAAAFRAAANAGVSPAELERQVNEITTLKDSPQKRGEVYNAITQVFNALPEGIKPEQVFAQLQTSAMIGPAQSAHDLSGTASAALFLRQQDPTLDDRTSVGMVLKAQSKLRMESPADVQANMQHIDAIRHQGYTYDQAIELGGTMRRLDPNGSPTDALLRGTATARLVNEYTRGVPALKDKSGAEKMQWLTSDAAEAKRRSEIMFRDIDESDQHTDLKKSLNPKGLAREEYRQNLERVLHGALKPGALAGADVMNADARGALDKDIALRRDQLIQRTAAESAATAAEEEGKKVANKGAEYAPLQERVRNNMRSQTMHANPFEATVTPAIEGTNYYFQRALGESENRVLLSQLKGRIASGVGGQKILAELADSERELTEAISREEGIPVEQVEVRGDRLRGRKSREIMSVPAEIAPPAPKPVPFRDVLDQREARAAALPQDPGDILRNAAGPAAAWPPPAQLRPLAAAPGPSPDMQQHAELLKQAVDVLLDIRRQGEKPSDVRVVDNHAAEAVRRSTPAPIPMGALSR